MAFTRILGPGIHTASNINSHNINSTGIITATAFVGNLTGNVTGGASSITGSPSVSLGNVNAGIATFTGALTGTTANFSGNVSVGGVLTYEDVKNVDSLGIITARSGVDVDGHTNLDNVNVAGVATFASTVNATLFSGASQIGIQSAGTQIGAGITQLNFVGTGNTFAVNGTTVDISIAGGGGGTGAGGTWSTYTAGIATTKSVGVNTSNLDDTDLTGIGNSFKGLYISNGMIVHDNVLNGNHYIGTSMNGLMAGPVTIDGNLEIDGNYVVV